ncbi:rhomboid-like protein 19 isoform X2 [Tasmannia lanceolata]|uniref:rhomboid-like protein 19 isoform X2 n=1 Tax=Tasmannia lanceolata TaxID=3420 RepID=UPI004062E77E
MFFVPSSNISTPEIQSLLTMVGLTGFTRLSKGLSAVLFIGYVVPLLFPWTTNYVALVPVKTIPLAWNVITAGYIEQSLFGLILSIFGLLISGKLLEPLWTAREFMKFIIFVNTFTLFGVYVTAVTFYYVTRREAFLSMQLSGFYGVLSGFLVGVKQAMPDQEVKILWNFHMKAEWLPSLLVLTSIVLSFFTSEAMRYLPFVLFGTYGGWIYLRYLQKNPETNLSGDPHDEFAFSTFFPLIIRERGARALDERLQDARDGDPTDEGHAIV